MTLRRAHLPCLVPIEAYGNGGFRFGGMSHRGSLLFLPTGVWGWPVESTDDLDRAAFEPVLGLNGRLAFLILGTGAKLVRPSMDVRQAFDEANIGLDFMDTGAAARTYNVLLAEGRPVGAALIAVA